MTIDLPINCFTGWQLVDAEIVDIAPHITQWTFAVHVSPYKGLFATSNIETGCRVGDLERTVLKATMNALRLLSTQDDESVRLAVRKLPKVCRT